MSRSRTRRKEPRKTGVRSTRFKSQTYRLRVKEAEVLRGVKVARRGFVSPPGLVVRGRSVRAIVRSTKVESTPAWKAPDYFGRAAVIRVMGEPSRARARTVCSVRHERRAVLFALRVAGENRRESPGQGGSYRRGKESKIKCR